MPPLGDGDDAGASKKQNQEQEPVLGSCTVCSKSCPTRCSHCKKAFYCSVDCQSSHRRTHKRDCFPTELIKTGEEHSIPYWLTTRDIKEGELIFSEHPVLCGPSEQMPKEYSAKNVSHIPICLGCMRILEPNYRKCSKCTWPVCNDVCEKNPGHNDAECVVFVAKKFGPTKKNMEEYNMISILRCLLLKSRDPRKWAQLMNMVPKSEKRGDRRTETERKMEQFEAQCQVEFFTDIICLKNITAAEIDHVTKVWNTLKVQPIDTRKTHSLNVIFPLFNFISHSCLPNTKSLDDGSGSTKFNTFATTKIPKGSKISNSIFYGNCMDGTKARRRALKSAGIECVCERCSDPTEVGTFMSAIKCLGESGCGHSDSELSQNKGYLLPRDPLDDNSVWECNSSKLASCKLSFTDAQISKILDPVWAAMSEFVRRADERSYDVLFRDDINHEDYVLICEMESYLDKMGKVLHPNHYFIFALKKKILIGMSSCISPVEINPQIVFRTHRLQIVERMQQLAEYCVKLAKIILPGQSLFTGRMLYFLAASKWIWITENVRQGGSVDQTLDELRQAGELNRRVATIFKDSPSESPEIMLLDYLKTWETIANEMFAATPAFASRLNSA